MIAMYVQSSRSKSGRMFSLVYYVMEEREQTADAWSMLFIVLLSVGHTIDFRL